MPVSKIAITIEADTLQRLDLLVKMSRFPNRSRAIQEALEEKISKIERNRLADECTKLDSKEEKTLAEEGISFEAAEWPEY